MTSTLNDKKETPKYMRATQLVKHLGIGKSTLYYYIKENKIPKGKKISERVVVFEVAEVEKALFGEELSNG
ncbi:helix-turn-helix transcriptional regulator [Arcobacter arenosus]|uniref:helix-turn-helix transcriptional regulator n=1 Tax=Arcobacter arenosus TaxID=2576037 RepID=UPI003BA8E854